MSEPLLSVRDLKVHFNTDDGIVKAVDGVSYDIGPGRTLGIVGESGSGKSVSSLTVMGLTRSRISDISGEIHFAGRDLLTLSEGEMRSIRGETKARRDHLDVFREFLDHLDRASRRKTPARTTKSAKGKSRRSKR